MNLHNVLSLCGQGAEGQSGWGTLVSNLTPPPPLWYCVIELWMIVGPFTAQFFLYGFRSILLRISDIRMVITYFKTITIYSAEIPGHSVKGSLNNRPFLATLRSPPPRGAFLLQPLQRAPGVFSTPASSLMQAAFVFLRVLL